MAHQEESHSTPAFIGSPSCELDLSPDCSSPGSDANTLLENCARLSLSLGENSLLKEQCCRSSTSKAVVNHHMTMDELKAVNRFAESTKSLSYLPMVHERQTARMRTRSEWFLNPYEQMFHFNIDSDPASLNVLKGSNYVCSPGTGLSASAESVSKRPSLRRTSSRTHYSRAATVYDKENGTESKYNMARQASNTNDMQDSNSNESVDSTGKKLNVNLSYKPRI